MNPSRSILSRAVVLASTASLATTLSYSSSSFSFISSSPFSSTSRMASCEAADESSVNLSRWQTNWKNDKIAFHQIDAHHTLTKHIAVLEGLKTIFVPLCGKTVDMTLLAKLNHNVLGVEGIQKAITDYAVENGRKGIHFDPTNPTKKYGPKFDCFSSTVLPSQQDVGQVEILKGDYFELKSIGSNVVDAIWDRASLVAIEPSLRKQYVECQDAVLKPSGVILLSVFERGEGTPEAIFNGPPFSVSESDVYALYKNQPWVENVELVEKIAIFDDPRYTTADVQKWTSAGLTKMYEHVFVIKKK